MEIDIERCKKEDEMWESAKLLFDIAVKAHMQRHDADRATTRRLLKDTAEVTD